MCTQGRSFASLSSLRELCLRASHTDADEGGYYDEHLPIPVQLAGLPANLHTLKVGSLSWCCDEVCTWCIRCKHSYLHK